MKVVIRSCNQRLWYVENFLVHQLQQQGISKSDIIVLNDDKSIGCLKHFISTLDYISSHFADEAGVWMLQDDVLLSKDFYNVALQTPKDKICNGFVCFWQCPNEVNKIGLQRVANYWYSFQCIYIPLKYIREFLDWFYQKCIVEGKYQNRVVANKYDDLLFWSFMKQRHPNDMVLNIVPNICQHIDWMIGGSIINKHWKKRLSAYYWNEVELENGLQQRIEVYRNGKTTERN